LTHTPMVTFAIQDEDLVVRTTCVTCGEKPSILTFPFAHLGAVAVALLAACDRYEVEVPPAHVVDVTTGAKLPAPWTDRQVEALNKFQEAGQFHPFTCGNDSRHRILVATLDGWICRDCDYRQSWAHAFMAAPE
jgi:hypothetical protein